MNLDMKLQEIEHVIDCLPIGIMVFGPHMHLRCWNDRALMLTGIGIEDVLSGNYSGLLSKDVRSMVSETVEQAGSSSRRILVEGDGRAVSYTSMRLPDSGNGCTLLIAEDATNFKTVEMIKQDFIGTLLHKLRGPLSTLKTSYAMMKGRAIEGLSPRAGEILDMGHHEINRLVTLVNDMRDLFIIETGLAAKEMEIEAFPLSSALDRAVEELGKTALPFDAVRRRLVRRGSLNIHVTTDFEKMKKIFFILLKNAMMYSREEDKVTVECDGNNDSVNIRVRDYGIGISEQSMPFLFGKYFREDNEATRTHEGNGLGLFMAKSFIELMKGTIYCESVEGKGCVFFISLPITGFGQ